MPITKTDKKVNGKQQYRVRVSYTDLAGVSHRVERTAYGLTEAKEMEEKLRRECNASKNGTIRDVAALYGEYLNTKQHEVRASTFEKDVRILNRYVMPSMQKYTLSDLTPDKLQKWKNSISSLDLQIKTKRNIYASFRGMLNYAVKMEYVQQNPLSKIGNFKNTDFTPPKDKLHYYTPEQFVKYISVARSEATTYDDWNYYTFFCIAYYTGMRKGEINALKWSDIDGNIINVRRSVTQKVKGKSLVETPPKNQSSYRTLQIPSPLMKVLEEQKQRYTTLGTYSDELRVCGGQECLSDTSISNRNIHFAKTANLPTIRIHDFRHSHASLLANEGINIQEIARRLGHSKVEETLRTYSHLYPREEERAVEILNKIQL